MSEIRVGTIINETGLGAPSFSNGVSIPVGYGITGAGGINISGIVTATSIVVSAGTTALPSISPSGDPNTGVFFPSADTIAFSEGGVEAMRVDSSGRLLVGTSTSNTGDLSQYSFLQAKGNSQGVGGAGQMSLFREENSSAIIADEVLGRIMFGDQQAGEYGQIHVAADGTAGVGDYPGRLVFSTTSDSGSSPTERMKITSGGGVQTPNTSTASHSFGVNRNDGIVIAFINANATSPYGANISFSGAAPNNGTNYFLNCADSSATRLELRSNGGLANYTANNSNLSDRNVKKDITLTAGTWDCIKEWEIVNYRYKDQPDDADLNLGVIAQQVAESCPEVITIFQEAKEATEDTPAQEERLGVKEQQMYWMAIKALQEAMERIEQLETEMAAVKSQLA